LNRNLIQYKIETATTSLQQPTTLTDQGRLHNLDYLRGLAAFGIMIFHYSTWTYGEFNAQTFLGRVGIYGVSIFYVLSGLTLHHVYGGKISQRSDLTDFFVKRAFRIFPLLWLAIIATIILNRDIPSLEKLILNVTGLFGVIQWDQYIGVGVWSIGNELAFYLFFPVFVFLSKKSRIGFGILALVLAAIYARFAFVVLDSTKDLPGQWRDYVNPLNQVFLFLGGFLIGMFFRDKKLSLGFCLLLIVSSFALFIFYPLQEETIHMVTGPARIVFTLICFAICIGFFRMYLKLPVWIEGSLARLGEASYSVYLLHPIVYKGAGMFISLASKYGVSFPIYFRLVLSIILTLIISNLVYARFEKYFMKKGRIMAEKLKSKQSE
jgi:exopolysaccharide production protein ExoZ